MSDSIQPIFISYRREDSAYVAASIADRLRRQFGKRAVFIDVDNIPLGSDFRQHINGVVARCSVVLVLIGGKWLKGEPGQRRIDEPADFVRLEVEAALQRNVPVVPVLVDNAVMPGPDDLPGALRELAFRNAAEIRPGRDLSNHLEALCEGIAALVEPRPEVAAASASVPRRRVSATATPAARRAPRWKSWQRGLYGGVTKLRDFGQRSLVHCQRLFARIVKSVVSLLRKIQASSAQAAQTLWRGVEVSSATIVNTSGQLVARKTTWAIVAALIMVGGLTGGIVFWQQYAAQSLPQRLGENPSVTNTASSISSSASAADSAHLNEVVATVDGTVITRGELQAECLRRHGDNVVKAAIIEPMMLALLAKHDVVITYDEIEAQIVAKPETSGTVAQWPWIAPGMMESTPHRVTALMQILETRMGGAEGVEQLEKAMEVDGATMEAQLEEKVKKFPEKLADMPSDFILNLGERSFTRAQLLDRMTTDWGFNTLEILVQKRIIENELRKRDQTVTAEDIAAERSRDQRLFDVAMELRRPTDYANAAMGTFRGVAGAINSEDKTPLMSFFEDEQHYEDVLWQRCAARKLLPTKRRMQDFEFDLELTRLCPAYVAVYWMTLETEAEANRIFEKINASDDPLEEFWKHPTGPVTTGVIGRDTDVERKLYDSLMDDRIGAAAVMIPPPEAPPGQDKPMVLCCFDKRRQAIDPETVRGDFRDLLEDAELAREARSLFEYLKNSARVQRWPALTAAAERDSQTLTR